MLPRVARYGGYDQGERLVKEFSDSSQSGSRGGRLGMHAPVDANLHS